MVKVLLIDDDAELVEMLKQYLEREGFEVTTANNGERGLEEALSGHHQIAILDIMMPRLNGLDTLRRIREKSMIPVLMLTARGDDADRVVGLELGADDYVAKPCTPREITARIRAILRRVAPATPAEEGPSLLQSGNISLWPSQRRVEWQGRPLVLTSTEFNLLEILVRNAGNLVSKGQLSEQALGHPMGRFERSIDVHISRIRSKLEEASPNGNECIKTVHGKGYLFVKE
jgi:two-component system OmpR family response regulator